MSGPLRTASPYSVRGSSSGATAGSRSSRFSPYIVVSSSQGPTMQSVTGSPPSPRVAPHIKLAREQQRVAHNLTTYDDSVGQLVTYSYPIDDDGNPIAPELLRAHSKTTSFPTAHCFCGRQCRWLAPRGGHLKDKHAFVCHSSYEDRNRCNFFVCIEEILEMCDIRYENYDRLKRPAGPVTPLRKAQKAISISTLSSGSSGDHNSSPNAPRMSKRELSIDLDVFGVIGYPSPLGPPTWRGSQPDPSSKSKGKKAVKAEVIDLTSSSGSSNSSHSRSRDFTWSGYSLPMPVKEDSGSSGAYDKALRLWSPPGGDLRLSPVRYIVPARGVAQVEEDLMSPVGVSTVEFWDLWQKCDGCDRIILGWMFDEHTVCDLTRA